MVNLEKLDLYLIIGGKQRFVDGNDLKKDILSHLLHLNQFSFNIRSNIRLFNDQINLPSNEYIQQTFKDNQIISCVDYFSKSKEGEYHIYSYPYRLKHYDKITNNFPGGIFKYVREISLIDERPFEHEFFLQIAESFAFVKILTLTNDKPQKNKLYSESKNYNQDFLISKYLHLTELYLDEVHDDYIEEFLLDSKTCLSNNIYLSVDYLPLERITQNFTRNTTRINCTKLICLCLHNIILIEFRNM
jgi:hypothetical protein